jgi:hypothetical protein
MKTYTRKNLKDAIEYLTSAVISETETVCHDDRLVDNLRTLKKELEWIIRFGPKTYEAEYQGKKVKVTIPEN